MIQTCTQNSPKDVAWSGGKGVTAGPGRVTGDTTRSGGGLTAGHVR